MENDKRKSYAAYSAVDFFYDSRFVAEVRSTGTYDHGHWLGVLQDYPEKAIAMEEARAWILLLRDQPVYRPTLDKSDTWQKIASRVERQNVRQERYIIPIKRWVRRLVNVAAVIFLVLALYEFFQYGDKRHIARYGETSTILLPDKSELMLNGNSEVRYSRNWKSNKPREIWMQGEVYFHVKHVAVMNRLQEADSFRVHVADLDLTVLGTKFNVKDRRGKTEISLLEGQLRIDRHGKTLGFLSPGESLLYDAETKQLAQADRKPVENKAWTSKELELSNYTLDDVIHILEDTYGYEVIMRAPEVADKKLTGTVPANNVEDILFVLEKVFNLRINQQSNQIIINRNPNQ